MDVGRKIDQELTCETLVYHSHTFYEDYLAYHSQGKPLYGIHVSISTVITKIN